MSFLVIITFLLFFLPLRSESVLCPNFYKTQSTSGSLALPSSSLPLYGITLLASRNVPFKPALWKQAKLAKLFSGRRTSVLSLFLHLCAQVLRKINLHPNWQQPWCCSQVGVIQYWWLIDGFVTPFQVVSSSARSVLQNNSRSWLTKLLVTNSAPKARQNLRTHSPIGHAVAYAVHRQPHLPVASFVHSISKISIFHSHKGITTFAVSFPLISVIPFSNNILAFSLLPIIRSLQLRVTAYAEHWLSVFF